jgi:hypothetical protein
MFLGIGTSEYNYAKQNAQTRCIYKPTYAELWQEFSSWRRKHAK